MLLSAALLVVGCKKDDVNTEKETINNSTTNSEGLLPGLFSIGEGKQIQFSQGNLQYQPATQKWRFASTQYDYVGEGNENIDANYEGWIDLFGWGTSGWQGSGAQCYMPYSTIVEPTYYFIGGSQANNLVGDYANADWGVYNAISNGGNKAGLWRTMTAAEQQYLFTQRTNAAQLFGLATVCGHFGVLLLPDNWNNADITFDPHGICATNRYNTETWKIMQEQGAVFFPAAGYRTVITPGMMEMNGLYWTSTANSATEDYVYALIFNVGATDPHGIGGIFPHGEGLRYLGLAVRLVRDVE